MSGNSNNLQLTLSTERNWGNKSHLNEVSLMLEHLLITVKCQNN